MPYKILLTYLYILFAVYSSAAQGTGYIYEDIVLDPKIKSVQLLINGQPSIVPIMLKGTRFTLTFDELTENSYEFFYKVIHCDRNWKASDLEEIEYLDGFNGEEIRDFEVSFNTYVDYVNYQLTLPNEDTQFRISGNYAIIIYDDEALTHPIFVKRFMITENKAKLLSTFQKNTDVVKSKTHHQLDIEVSLEELYIVNPKTDLYLTVIQNSRWDNMLQNFNPKFISRNVAQFDNTGELSFPAGKEFRSFDTRTLNYTTEFVKHIELHPDGSDVVLHTDRPRGNLPYTDELDFDGRYVIALHDQSEDDIRADYSNVYFGLESKYKRDDDIYVVGSFTGWKLNDLYKMTYRDGLGYLLVTPLKQGVYNYLYATEGKDGKPSYEFTEGDSFKTVNYYTIILYYYDRALGYDRIIGSEQLQSSEQLR